MIERREIPVKSIVLNPGNFRHDPVGSPEEAMSALFSEKASRDQLLVLATDIAGRGLDPSSLMILEPEGDYWRVLEGNRRTAVLRCLENPDRIPEAPGFEGKDLNAYRQKFRALGQSAVLPEFVLAVVTDDEALADHLIMLKHAGLGAHNGAGTVVWDTAGRTRHEQSVLASAGRPNAAPSNRQTAHALAVLDAFAVHFAGDPEIEEHTARARRGGLTTLGRLLGREENRVRLGLQIDGSEVRFLVTRAALRRGMLKVLSDLGTYRLNSRSTNKAADVVAYLDGIAAELPDRDDRLPEAEPATAPEEPADSKPERRRQKQSTPVRKPFQGLVLNAASASTLAVLGELKGLRIDDNPYACAVLTRVLLDLYTNDVLTALGDKKIPQTTQARARKCLRLVDTDSRPLKDRAFPQMWNQLTDGTGDLSIDAMHLYLHRRDFKAHPELVRLQSEHYGPFLTAIDRYVEDHTTVGPT